MDEIKEPLFLCLECLKADIDSKEKIGAFNFKDFLELTRNEPERVLRNIFQLFYDMVKTYVGEGVDEYPNDPESIGFVKYDCSRIFVKGADSPFFPDRLFANRFVNQVDDFKRGSQQNRMHVYLGSPGSGKSIFLDNLLRTFEKYTKTKEGETYEIYWDIEDDSEKVEIPCPSHDHPILIIPKDCRTEFLDRLLSEETPELRQVKFNISHEKEYEWLFKKEACTICISIFDSLCQKFGSVDKVLNMIKVRPYQFNRKIGEGISVFNPGDKPMKEIWLSDKQIQERLDKIFRPNQVKYLFSPLARTNNGIYVLMDVKEENFPRFLELHNVISEGVHKVNDVEERINSLFLALMNPGDRDALKKKTDETESFEARIQYNKISYVMEVSAEVAIYRSIFGNHINLYFLPRVMENFARLIISSRMNPKCEPLQKWIPDMVRYSGKHLCDKNGLLLRMEIYSGVIPDWLGDEDRGKFTSDVRRSIITEAENEGNQGFSGRESIKHFGALLRLFGPKANNSKSDYLITMANITDYFRHRLNEKEAGFVSKEFISSLVDWYDCTVLNEMKESLYFYNKEQIREDILHYLCAINYDANGGKIRCVYTGKEIEVTVEFFKLIGSYILGRSMDDIQAIRVARDYQKKYVEIIAREAGKDITETELYKELFSTYSRNLKEKVLEPFIGNDSFREAIKSFGSKEFEAHETRLKTHVSFMIKNLISKFGYTEQGAKKICLYVIEQGLVEKFK